jgi:hypothetical protein
MSLSFADKKVGTSIWQQMIQAGMILIFAQSGAV